MNNTARPAVSRSLWIWCGAASALISVLVAFVYLQAPPEHPQPALFVACVAPLGACVLMTLIQDLGRSVRHTAVSILREAQKPKDD